MSSITGCFATLYVIKRNIDPQSLTDAKEVAPCLKLPLHNWPINSQFLKMEEGKGREEKGGLL